MEHYAGIDVSLESASLCVVDATGRIVRKAKMASEPEVLIGVASRSGACGSADQTEDCGAAGCRLRACGCFQLLPSPTGRPPTGQGRERWCAI